MTIAQDLVLDPVRRATLATLAELIIPAAAGMPSATEIDLAGAPFDRVLKVRRDLMVPLVRLLDAVADRASEDTLDCLDRAADSDFEALLEAVLGAYYMHADVRERIGYEGQLARTLPRAGFGAEDLVADMMAGPARFRKATP